MVSKDRIVSEFITLASMDAPTGSERPVADYCIRALEALGFRVTEDDAGAALGGSAGNLHAFLVGEGEPILFSCHMDTVTPCLAKQIIQEPDGRIHTDGRTILGADDAAGIAEILEGVRSVLEDQLAHRPVEVVLSVSEEQKLLGAKHFDIHQLHAKEAYILDVDGTIGTAVIAAPRAYRFFATVHGRSAHAALSPELGINAAVIAAEAVAQLPWGRLDADTTSNVGIVRVEGAANIVPAECYLTRALKPGVKPLRAPVRATAGIWSSPFSAPTTPIRFRKRTPSSRGSSGPAAAPVSSRSSRVPAAAVTTASIPRRESPESSSRRACTRFTASTNTPARRS